MKHADKQLLVYDQDEMNVTKITKLPNILQALFPPGLFTLSIYACIVESRRPSTIRIVQSKLWTKNDSLLRCVCSYV